MKNLWTQVKDKLVAIKRKLNASPEQKRQFFKVYVDGMGNGLFYGGILLAVAVIVGPPALIPAAPFLLTGYLSVGLGLKYAASKIKTDPRIGNENPSCVDMPGSPTLRSALQQKKPGADFKNAVESKTHEPPVNAKVTIVPASPKP